MIVELLTEHHLEFLSLKGGCTGSSESTLVKMSHCWKSHAAAHIVVPDGNPWYDTEIRRNSRKREIQKKAIKSGNPNDWNKYNLLRYKVNNQKKGE